MDGDSKFLWVDMGAARSTSDAQIFRHKMENISIGFPDSESLGIGGQKVNFFLLGDDAFPLTLWLIPQLHRKTLGGGPAYSSA